MRREMIGLCEAYKLYGFDGVRRPRYTPEGFWSEVYGRLYLSELRKTLYWNWNSRVLLSLWTAIEVGGVMMLTVGEWVDKVHEITDTLEHKATESCDEYIRKAQSYRDGYIQACEDFGREMRRAISKEQG